VVGGRRIGVPSWDGPGLTLVEPGRVIEELLVGVLAGGVAVFPMV
jgi:hypothetical protein